MMPSLSGLNRVTRLFAGAAVISVGAALWSGAPDLFALLGVTTIMTGVVGWCPIHDWFSNH
ncbi:MAG TPA: DUF2892 domain-containing protein [Vicinamibacterales bacterium]|jgi:hypothetical protein|nr:DUF2892 domain-containing protein [Vicinamibacterales bacterium]